MVFTRANLHGLCIVIEGLESFRFQLDANRLILPGKEGLVHISQLSTERVGKVEDVVSVGDEIVVKVTEIDQKGRINLSRKAVLANGLEK